MAEQPTEARDRVISAVSAAFAGHEAQALECLDRYGTAPHERERERVQLAIVALAGGSLEQLPRLVADAKRDYRDVLAWHQTGPLSPADGERLRSAARAILDRWGRQ